MHKYKDALICKEMRALKPDVSEIDQHIGFLVTNEVGERGNWEQLLVIGAHETLIPAVLGGTAFNYVVYALAVHGAYMERQWHLLRLARMRYRGRCLARPLQSPYKAMVNFGDTRFRYILVMPDVDFNTVREYCKHYLSDLDGVMIVAQRGPTVDAGGMGEVWKRHLKNTPAGYCIECEEERAEWIVAGLTKK